MTQPDLVPQPGERYTDETKARLSVLLHGYYCGCKSADCALRRSGGAAWVLDHLADDGLLLSPGGQVREECRVTYLNRHNDRVILTAPHSWMTRERAEADLAQAIKEGRWHDVRIESRHVTTFPDGSVLTGVWDPPWEKPASVLPPSA